MALIQCPECGHKVSTMADACPNCGCPVRLMVNVESCVINGVKYDLSQQKQMALNGDFAAAAKDIKKLSGLELVESKDIVDRIRATGKVPPEYPFPDTPRCPTGGSTDIRKLSAGERGVSLGLFGLASKTARSQFVCENCGYKW